MQDCKIKLGIKKVIFFLIFFLTVCGAFSQKFYWENPQVITKNNSQFPRTLKMENKDFLFWQEVDSSKKQIWISYRAYSKIDDFVQENKVIGPFNYSNEVPDIYSVAKIKSNSGGRAAKVFLGEEAGENSDENSNNVSEIIAIAVLSDVMELSVFTSSDYGKTFEKNIIETNGSAFAPRIYTSNENEFIIFFSESQNNQFSISYSVSKDGKNWESVKSFNSSGNLLNPFIPVLIPLKKYGGNLLVFQAQYLNQETQRLTYQLYGSFSKDLDSWSKPVLLTGPKSLLKNEQRDFSYFQNQRPFLYEFNDEIYLSWERTDTINSSIWVSKINIGHNFELTEIDASSLNQLSESGSASNGILFSYNDKLYIVWFDTRTGRDSVYLAEQNGNYWEEQTLAENKNSNTFAYPLILHNSTKNTDTLAFAWQQSQKSKNSISVLLPDTSVKNPSIVLKSPRKKRAKEKNITATIKFPEDSSQIAGYSYTWQKDESQEPANQIKKFTKDNTLKLKAPEDGKYYLSVKVADYAGNWSNAETLEYHLDLTPPKAPTQIITKNDRFKMAMSNTFNVSWEASEDDDVVGYTYTLEYLGSVPKKLFHSKRHPLKLNQKTINQEVEKLFSRYEKNKNKNRKLSAKNTIRGTKSQRYYNLKNGVYAFSVAAVDTVGNIGNSKTELIILNKFEPSTYISSISQFTDEMGGTTLTINGGGFTYDGTISKIYIDQDGLAPYDVTLELANNQFKVKSDSKITQVIVETDVQEGNYKIGLHHTDRGVYFSNKIIKITQSGTIKIESEYVPQKYFAIENYSLLNIEVVRVLLILIALLFLLISVYVVYTNLVLLKENKLTNKEVNVIFTGEPMPLVNKEKKRKSGRTVKGKFVAFTFLLITIVVIAVAFQVAKNFIQIQEKTIADGLQNQMQVLLKSISSGTKNFFPTSNILELSALPSQKSAMDEVKYVTIVGQPEQSNSSENLKFVWASNDEEIDSKIDNYSFEYGVSQITDEKVIDILKKFENLDKEINVLVGDTSKRIEELTKEATQLSLSTAEEDQLKMQNLSEISRDLRNNLDSKLEQIAEKYSGSYPYFDTYKLDRNQMDYIFYHPVLYRQGASENYLHCVVIAELSTKELIQNLDNEIKVIIILCGMIALIAVIGGGIGAYFFASILVKPIKKLESHVNLVGRTKNKLDLRGKDVKIKSKDEIGHLGDSLNNMVHDMIAVAEEESLALDGKAVQKAFLPLVDAGFNNKKTYAEYKDNDVECFGYYEGESGVSGDYFDYKRLDNQWFVAIKCDASGHGIPAAIIMTVVATIFRRYFSNWSYQKNGINFNKLVEQINDFIESLGLKGKFATLIICLLNMKTGELYMCNAGDNLVHIYDGNQRKMKTITLASAPTAGIFSSDLVNIKGGFIIEKTQLNKGDVLYLYTDGIEESTRRIRNRQYQVQQQNVEVRKMNPKTHKEEIEYKTEDIKEEFGVERIEQIIECVFSKQKFVLTKEQNPNAAETLAFDFSKGEGTISESILALASIEKVYRMYKNPETQENQYIKVDRKIDEFLEKYFSEYPVYAVNKADNQTLPNYVDYENIQEDEQSDDLTMLAIRRL